ncbi:hypothetical protein ATE92_1609 [Ulvibacter sp. MAR_2010_11]|uniref:polysaccharide deacetylase family protein n=1 Tax=Ulvibacter sp. MAR_2010_11 TaxID=1250229 RepID=UPI000C2B9135|nr:polysaccharide deacetylase family protein [Ulvibacter sp. MAR_2010_11]PKA83454.1 hypothetical protein ATE92_1609 [Ulvibacter sp. MAR_2010_11]
MLLIYTQKITPRITYIFKHVCTRILGIEVTFTLTLEEFISYEGPKLSYGKQPLGNELFIQSNGLLTQQGFESETILVKEWEETKCFFATSEKSMLPFDIFAAGFYLLSRYEEYLPHVKDALGHFPASESLGFMHNFLHQPVIDIWAYKFKTILVNSFPHLLFPKKEMTIHSVINAGEPYAFRQRGALRSLVGYSKDFSKFRFRRMVERTAVISGTRSDPFDTFQWIINATKKSRNKLSVFFMLGDALVFDESINSNRQKFKLLLKYVADYKDVGLIFSYSSLPEYDSLKKEKLRMQDIINRDVKHSFNSQFLVNLPETYRNLVELEIKSDFTMVYENTPGFRAGTCTPFLFYDLDYEIKTPLIIHPVVVTTSAFKSRYASDISKTVAQLMIAVEQVNGTFSMLFSNRDFSPLPANDVWRSLFSEKLHPNE